MKNKMRASVFRSLNIKVLGVEYYRNQKDELIPKISEREFNPKRQEL